MKIHTCALLTLLSLGFSAGSLRAADPALWGTAQAVTIALTFSYTGPSLKMKDATGLVIPIADGGGLTSVNDYEVDTMNANGDTTKTVVTHEEGTKAVVVKYGNAEILKQLLTDGILIPVGTQTDAAITGWSLVVVGDGTGVSSLFARHATAKVMVPVDGYSFGLDTATPGGHADTDTEKQVTTDTFNIAAGTDVMATVYSGSYSTKGAGIGMVTVDANPVMLAGLYTDTGKTTVKTEKFPDMDPIITPIWTPGAAKLDKIIGTVSLTVDPDVFDAVVEGSMSLGAATVVDMNLYAPPTI